MNDSGSSPGRLFHDRANDRETLTKTLGREIRGRGSFSAGREVVQEVLAGFAVPRESWSMSDGSGLSRYNYIAPEHLVRLLRGMYRRKDFPLFFDCLPIAGVAGTRRHWRRPR